MRLRGFLLLQLGVYVDVCVHLCVCIHLHVYTYKCVQCKCIHTCMCIHLHVYTLAHALRHLNLVAAPREIQLLRKLNHKNIVKLKVLSKHLHTHTHTNTHTRTHTHTRVYTPTRHTNAHPFTGRRIIPPRWRRCRRHWRNFLCVGVRGARFGGNIERQPALCRCVGDV